MTVKKENSLLVLWVIFGFFCVSAIDAILYLMITIFYGMLIEFGSSYSTLTILVPILTFFLSLGTTIILINRFKIKSRTEGIYLIDFPKKLSIVFGLIAILLPALINKLSGLIAERSIDNMMTEDNSNYLTFYGWFNIGFGVSQILAIILLFSYFLITLRKTKIN